MEIIDPKKFLVRITSILDKLNINYFITGGFAVAIWGRPRSTSDIDAVVQIDQSQVKHLAQSLKDFSKLGYIDEGIAQEAIRNKGEFNFIDPNTGLKVDFWIAKNDALASLQFKRKKREVIGGKDVYFISPEDLILNKLLWHKNSGSMLQLDDIGSIFKISGKKLDMKYLRQWTVKLEVADILNNIINDKKERP